MGRVIAFCGGVGGAKLAFGLARGLRPDELTLIVNTGDDFEHLGLLICPDLDTVTYTLAGVENPATGWGRAEETWAVRGELEARGAETWFQLGDKDIAHHLRRRALLDGGATLTAATIALTRAFGIAAQILPLSDDPVRTIVETEQGPLAFQDYFVRERCAPKVKGFRFEGAETARLSPEVKAAFADRDLRGIILCPSNPFVSIGPMLALPALRDRLEQRTVPALAVSPIIGGKALKGPADKMMTELGFVPSCLSVAQTYKGLIDAMVIDTLDKDLGESIAVTVKNCFVSQTVMRTGVDRVALARACLDYLDLLADESG